MLKQNNSRTEVAIIGSGPSGFYAAEAILSRMVEVHIDMYDRLPTPFGLVRGGVAPDHFKIKQVAKVFDRIARNHRFRFIGNVELGRDITLEEILNAYDIVILACGAKSDRRLDVPGENLAGSHTATEFVGWYNGHPDYRDREFDLSAESAIIIGHGNVAADVARVLARPVEAWRCTDMSSHAIDTLANSKIKDIYLVGRRGPAQAKFTTPELKELTGIVQCSPIVDGEGLALVNQACETELADPHNETAQKNVALFRSLINLENENSVRRLHFMFGRTPIRVNGKTRVQSVAFAKNRLTGSPFQQVAEPTGAEVELPCGVLFRSVGYRGVPIEGAAFEPSSGTVRNVRGRCTKAGGVISGLYVTGWMKRGASGVIGTNRADSIETVECALSDLSQSVAEKPGIAAILPKLKASKIRVVDYGDWSTLDTLEITRGRVVGKPREKFTRIAEMLAHLPTVAP